MKILNIIWVALLTLLITSCAKDDTNYDIQPLEIITITGIESAYTKTAETDRLTLTPTVSSNKPGAKFEYFWGIYDGNAIGAVPKMDTLAKTKDLDYLVKKAAKGWVLLFRATNTTTGYSAYFKSTVDVVTPFTRGWYVAKDDGTKADLDLFLTPQTSMPEGKYENIFSKVNGKALDGKATFLNFASSYRSDITGVFANTRTLLLLAEKDMSAINLSTLTELKGFNQLFYDVPTVKAPSMATYGLISYQFLNNGGQIYNMATTGVYTARKIRDDKNTPYSMSKYFLFSYLGQGLFFDELTSSFVGVTSSPTMVLSTDDTGTAIPANNNNKKLLFMGVKTLTYPDWGYAVFQDKTDPSIKTLSKVGMSGAGTYKLTIGNESIKTTDKLYNATRHTLLDGDENLMYFVVGNQVWSRNLTNKAEQLQFTAEPGEEITYLRHRKYAVSADLAYNYNYMVIGTAQGGNYKVHMFTKTSGNLNAKPAFTLTGKGFARDVIYISPSVTETTYNPSF